MESGVDEMKDQLWEMIVACKAAKDCSHCEARKMCRGVSYLLGLTIDELIRLKQESSSVTKEDFHNDL